MDNEFKKDFEFSNPDFFKASNEEDQKFGIDFWIFNLPVAYRKRRIKCPGDITIRYKRLSGSKTEFNKIIDGTFKARLFIYQFQDKVIFCNLESIKKAIINNQFNVIPNFDKKTWLAIIELENIKYLEYSI